MKNKFKEYGLVDLQQLDREIAVKLQYATSDNLTGAPLYPEEFGAYCEPRLAQAIVSAHRMLKEFNKKWSFLILDAARPISVQRTMFDKVKGTPAERYVANPYGEYQGGFHNYGMAVDLTIVDGNGNWLDMGSGFDEFSELAHVGAEYDLYMRKMITQEAFSNRMMLYYVMSKNDLFPYPYEWWHFQIDQSEESKNYFKLLDF